MEQAALRIGDWWAPCCVHDLQQITTEADLVIATTMIPFAGGWSSLDAALRDLLGPDRYVREDDRQEEIAYARATWPDHPIA